MKPTYQLCEIVGETILIKQRTRDIDFTRIISLNKSAKYLYEHFVGKEFALDDVVYAA